MYPDRWSVCQPQYCKNADCSKTQYPVNTKSRNRNWVPSDLWYIQMFLIFTHLFLTKKSGTMSPTAVAVPGSHTLSFVLLVRTISYAISRFPTIIATTPRHLNLCLGSWRPLVTSPLCIILLHPFILLLTTTWPRRRNLCATNTWTDYWITPFTTRYV